MFWRFLRGSFGESSPGSKRDEAMQPSNSPQEATASNSGTDGMSLPSPEVPTNVQGDQTAQDPDLVLKTPPSSDSSANSGGPFLKLWN